MAQSDEGAIVLTFSDSGDGIAPELRDRVFEHGFSTKPAGAEGRGVGLALVRSIVDAEGGTLEIEDSPTTLRVTLPAKASR